MIIHFSVKKKYVLQMILKQAWLFYKKLEPILEFFAILAKKLLVLQLLLHFEKNWYWL
jgi:hypothetical protein